jgi:hypothetical protein
MFIHVTRQNFGGGSWAANGLKNDFSAKPCEIVLTFLQNFAK